MDATPSNIADDSQDLIHRNPPVDDAGSSVICATCHRPLVRRGGERTCVRCVATLVEGEADRFPVIKVIDFGLAKAVTATASLPGATQAHGAFVGTPAFASPEQFDSAGSTRTDHRGTARPGQNAVRRESAHPAELRGLQAESGVGCLAGRQTFYVVGRATRVGRTGEETVWQVGVTGRDGRHSS